MRIASLVPSATEALFALGFGESVVAVTHECDHPPEVAALPRLTASVIPDGLEQSEIDRRVRQVTGRGEALYRLDERTLAELEPDLIVTQALCAVCAVSYDDVRAVAAGLPGSPRVISLDPASLDEVFADLVILADACGDEDRGERLRDHVAHRVARVEDAMAGARRPRVAALEWLDPPYVGGHWVPEMVAAAGGQDVLGKAGLRSREVSWGEVTAASCDVAVAMPCGLYADQATAECARRRDRLDALGAELIVAVDAASSFSRPGPRLADGVELLAHVLQPERWPQPPAIGWSVVAATAAGRR